MKSFGPKMQEIEGQARGFKFTDQFRMIGKCRLRQHRKLKCMEQLVCQRERLRIRQPFEKRFKFFIRYFGWVIRVHRVWILPAIHWGRQVETARRSGSFKVQQIHSVQRSARRRTGGALLRQGRNFGSAVSQAHQKVRRPCKVERHKNRVLAAPRIPHDQSPPDGQNKAALLLRNKAAQSQFKNLPASSPRAAYPPLSAPSSEGCFQTRLRSGCSRRPAPCTLSQKHSAALASAPPGPSWTPARHVA